MTSDIPVISSKKLGVGQDLCSLEWADHILVVSTTVMTAFSKEP